MVNRVRGALVLIALAGVAVCTDPVETERLIVTASVTPEVFFYEDSTLVRVIITNAHDVPLTVPSGACPFPFEVITTNRTVVGPQSEICLGVASFVTLAPGDSLVIQRRWNGQGRTDDFSTVLLPPGDYWIAPRAGLPGGAPGRTVAIRIMP